MRIRYPAYYKDFVCIASACPDSCCKEWSVDVDEQTAAFYRSLSGELGDRLRDVLQDTDNSTILQIQDGRCPMWRQDGLCRIQAELGHDALCKVCREFPRLRHDYGDFVELGLELSCPEAARLILSGKGGDWVTETVHDPVYPGYDTDVMAALLRSREDFLSFLDSTVLPFPQILTVLLLYAHDVQEEVDGGEKAVLVPENLLADASHFHCHGSFSLLRDFFLELEILTPRWEALLKVSVARSEWNGNCKALLRYFIGRWWLQAVSDYDILCRAKFVIAACLLIGSLEGEFAENAQLFSKEIENDPDNVDAILDGAYTAQALTDMNLLYLLMGGM